MGVDGVGAVEVGPGAAAAADGLVVLVGGVAEGEVVHGALTGRQRLQRTQQGVGGPLGGLDIAGAHRRRPAAGEDGALRDHQLDGHETAVVERDVLAHQRPEDVEHHRAGHRRRGVEVPVLLFAGSGEVDPRRAALPVHVHPHPDHRAEVVGVFEGTALQPVDDPPHALLGVLLDVVHVGLDHVQPEGVDHGQQLVRALAARRHLGLEVGHVLARVAGRPGPRIQQLQQFLFAKAPFLHQQEVVDQHAFLVDVPRIGRHGPGGDAADVGMVCPRGGEEQQPAVAAEDRHDHRHVGKMRAAVVGVVQAVGVARLHGAAARADHRAHRFAHGAEVHRHVGRVGDEEAVAVEDGAGEIEPLLDIDRVGGVLQYHAHLLGDVHVEIVEDLQHDGVALGAHRDSPRQRHRALHDHVFARGDGERPARLHHDGGGGIHHDGRPVDAIPRAQIRAHIDRRVEPGGRLVRAGGGEDAGGAHGPQRLFGRARDHRPLRLLDLLHGADTLDGDRLGHQLAALDDEAVATPVLGLEGGAHGGRITRRHLEGGVGALVAHVYARLGADARIGDVLGAEVGADRLLQLVDGRVQLGLDAGNEFALERLLADGAHVGEADAVGREHRGVGVDHDPADPQQVRHLTGVLGAGAAEADQRVAGDVDAALDGDLLDGVRHVVVGDLQAAPGDLLGAAGDAGGRLHLPGQLGELRVHDVRIERLVGVRAEDLREELRQQLADHEVGVGHRQRAAAAVAGRAGIGAGALGSDAEARAVEGDDGAAARGHRVDPHHGRAQPHAGDLGLEGALVLAGVVRHVGGGAAHVEADDAPETGEPGRLHRTHHAAGRAGEDGVLAAEVPGVHQPAVALHEHEPHAPELACDPVHVRPQDGREIGVHHGGVAAADDLDERARLVGEGDLGEADLAGDLAHPPLVLREAVGVHQHDGHRAEALVVGLLQAAARLLLVERRPHPPVGHQPLGDLDDARVHQLGQLDPQREDVGPVLVADAELVAEALGDGEHGGRALALEQRVGGHRGAHLDRLDGLERQRLVRGEAEDVADALDGGVLVPLRVLREQLVDADGAVGRAGHHVGEGAAPVDPELPAARHGAASPRDVPRRAGCSRAVAAGHPPGGTGRGDPGARGEAGGESGPAAPTGGGAGSPASRDSGRDGIGHSTIRQTAGTEQPAGRERAVPWSTRPSGETAPDPAA
ncbi:hypothetical protein HRbin39_01343 [bacterium HR39]|nr:hypothetical protein HRbin39_01343 [bacterium HR39]